MEPFDKNLLKKLYIPSSHSHKGQNGKLLIIGGSHLFHASSIWAAEVASRIVDMVFFSSVPENNELKQKAKERFMDGIVVPQEHVEAYINEADAILIGPGMVRTEEILKPTENYQLANLAELKEIENEGIQTYYITKYLLEKYPNKKWVIDAGALQMMEPEWLEQLSGNVILTPHVREFEKVFNFQSNQNDKNSNLQKIVAEMAKKYNCVILLKGEEDVVCGPFDIGMSGHSSAQGEIRCTRISGGNAGMTKGGTGDVLAGLVAALACKNDLFLAAAAGSYINKTAGEELFKRVGYYFNASDLMKEIPVVMKKILL